jgi:type I restriction enzyme S subunit
MPTEWTEMALGELCLKITDGSHHSPPSVPFGKPMASVKDLTPFGLDLKGARNISLFDYDLLVKQECQPKVGDVLIAKDGNSALDTTCLVKEPLSVVLLSSVAILRPNPKKLLPEYLKQYLSSPETISYLKSEFISGGVIPRVILKDFKRAIVNLPSIREQHRIAHILGTLDDKIENNRKTAKTLEAMAQAIFKSWFVDFDPVRAKMAGESRESICKRLKLTPEILDLFPDRLVDSELGGIPDGWRVDSIYQIADVIYGAPFNSSEFNAKQVGEPLIRIRDLTTEVPGVWTTETHPKGYKVKRGDIVVGMDGEFRAHIWGGAEAWLNQRLCIFSPKKIFSSLFVRNSIVALLAHVEATETATTVIHIGKNDIDLFRIIMPENNVLHTFNRLYQPLYDTLVIAKWETHKLGNTRDTILPKLVSGEIRVPESQYFVEAAIIGEV